MLAMDTKAWQAWEGQPAHEVQASLLLLLSGLAPMVPVPVGDLSLDGSFTSNRWDRCEYNKNMEPWL